MTMRGSTLVWTAVGVIGLLPGIAAAVPIDPTAVGELSAPVRAVGGVVAVLVFGSGFLTYSERLLDRSVDATLKSVPRSTFYGLTVHFVVVFASSYILSQIGRFIGDASVGVLILAGISVLAIAGYGFTVVGMAVTGFRGNRRPWLGLAIGAGIAGVAMFLLPFAIAAIVWVVVVSVGVGGSAREWFHASHSERGPGVEP